MFSNQRYLTRGVYSEIPITASEIAKRVNALVNEENRQKLTYDDISAWLIPIFSANFLVEMSISFLLSLIIFANFK